MNEHASQTLSKEMVLMLLSRGEMEVRGLMPGSSNYTFLADVRDGRYQGLAVYKPSQGETPLWDFPHGTLCHRELAAYLVSEALGWRLVPPTVMRIGPYGRGAVQLFIDADFRQHYFTLQDDPTYRLALQQVAAFDLIINNADRKSGHCLLDEAGQIWAIDHGVCFHSQPKLRTVIWDFADQPVPQALLRDLARLRAQLEVDCDLYQALSQLLSQAEMRALVRRLERLLVSGIYPSPHPHHRSYPWPLV